MDDARKLIDEIARGLDDLAKKVRMLGNLLGASQARSPAPETGGGVFDAAQAEIEAENAAEEPVPAPAVETPHAAAESRPKKASLPAGPVADFVAEMLDLEGEFEKAGLPVDPQDVAFAKKAEASLAGLTDEDRDGEKGAKVLFECLKSLDRIRVNYDLPAYAETVRKVFDVSCRLLSHLEAEKGFEIFPRPLEETTQAVKGRISSYDKAVKEHRTFDERPAGSITGVLQHGAFLKGKPHAPAQIIVSRGEDNEVSKLGKRALQAVLKEAQGGGEQMFRAAAELRKFMSRFGEGQDEEPVTARYILNVLHENNSSGAFKKIISAFLDHLRKLGYAEIIATTGKMFDESYSPNKYERRKVASSEPEGMIVAVLQRGFLDRNGVAVQKAVVAVSSG